MKPFPRLVAVALAAMIASVAAGHAARALFAVDAMALDGSGIRRSASASSLIELVQDVIQAEGKFSVFENRASFAALDYAGVGDAITFEQNATGTRAVFRIPITGLERVFTGDDRDEVEDKIVDFFREDGREEYEKFIEALNRRSKVSPIDGNPNAATARLAAATFGEFGFGSPESVDRNASGVSILAEVGRFTSGQFDGEVYVVPLSFTLKLTERVSVVVNIPLSYLVVEGSESFNVGFGLSLPVRFLQATDGAAEDEEEKVVPRPPRRWTWQVTPTLGAIASGSADFGTGGIIGQVAMTSMLAYKLDRFTLTMGNHVSWLEGIPFEVADYDVSSGVQQILLKNGLQLSVPLGERWLVTTYGIHTAFLEDAAVNSFFTFGGELGFKLIPNAPSYLKLGFYSDIGNDYRSANVRLGTGWRF